MFIGNREERSCCKVAHTTAYAAPSRHVPMYVSMMSAVFCSNLYAPVIVEHFVDVRGQV